MDLQLTVTSTTSLTAENEEALAVENIEEFVHLSIQGNFLFLSLLLSFVQDRLHLLELFLNTCGDGAILEESLVQQNVDFQPRLDHHGRQINGQIFVAIVVVVVDCPFPQKQSLLEHVTQSWQMVLRKFSRFTHILKDSF